MVLTFEITKARGREFPVVRRMLFRTSSATIGRSVDNDWVLSDVHVSSHHARVTYSNGEFQIEDTSTNGVFINDQLLGRGNRAILKSGDVITIDPYDIHASLSDDQSAAPRPLVGDPFERPTDEVDPLNLLNLDPIAPRSMGPRAEQLGNKPAWSDHYEPPTPLPSKSKSVAGGVIPENYDPLVGTGQLAVPDPTPPSSPAIPVAARRPVPASPPRRPTVVDRPASPVPAGSPQQATGADPSEVLKGAGLTGLPMTPEVARDFGRVLRIVVAGLMDILQSRQGIKSEFRMQVTSFQPTENNPLKFSANVEDALHNLLVKKNPAYLGTVEAFEDAYDDLRNHQIAMLEGMRAAFEKMLKTFDPEQLQKEFEKKNRGSLVPAKLRYWDQYKAEFSDMVSDADRCFRDLFGDEFAKAYEEQLEQLKARRGPRRPRS